MKGNGTKSVYMMDIDRDNNVDQKHIKTLGMEKYSINTTDDVIEITPQINDVSIEMELDT